MIITVLNVVSQYTTCIVLFLPITVTITVVVVVVVAYVINVKQFEILIAITSGNVK
jgi:hypothetical protein